MTFSSALLAGRSRVDITVWEPGRVMMGWADPRNVARRTGDPLEARAIALHDTVRDERFVFVCVELGIVTDRLRDAVLARVARRTTLPERGLMLAATHNHSGPGGFAGYLWYDLPSGGFSSRVFETLADRIADTVVLALASMEPATMRFVRGPTALRRYATNRAWRAYNRNPEVTPVTVETAELAVDSEMQLLRVDAEDGRPLGMINWFGLHGTCFHGDGVVVQPDHKGVASRLFEAREAPGFVAIFAQGPAGDITSNRRFDPRRGVTVGPGADDAESCARVASLEVEAARELFERAVAQVPETGPIVVASRRERLAEREVSERHAGGVAGRRTTLPIVALGMALGTDEGPGPLHPAHLAQRAIAAATRFGDALGRRLGRAADDNVQVPLVVFGAGLHARLFGVLPAEHRFMPTRFIPELGETFRRIREGETKDHERWLPTEADVQIACLGSCAIVGIGAEPTTVAGWRLRDSVARALGSAGVGVEHVVISTYTNAYSGYLVTPEEHIEQGYESGATIFGRWTLPAWQTALDAVALTLA